MTSGKNVIIGLAFLLGCSVFCGSMVNLLRPDGGIPWVGEWDHLVEAKAIREGLRLVHAEDAKQIVDEGVYLLFDARPQADFEAGHLPMAISIPYEEADTRFEDMAGLLTPEQPVLVYCSGQTCDESFELSLLLRDNGFTNLVLFVGGMEAWNRAAYPVEVGP